MNLLYLDSEIYLWGMTHETGKLRRSLPELKEQGRISNEVEALAGQGYKEHYSIGPGESLQSLAAAPFGRLLQQCPNPSALVFHHSYAENTWVRQETPEPGFMSQLHFFPVELMQQFKIDHAPYLVSFGSGCTGLISMLMTAAGLCAKVPTVPIICLTADVIPSSTTFDALREKILTSDCSSGFLLGREQRGYRLLGLSYYSSSRQVVPLVEIVKRSVQMIRELAKEAATDLSSADVVIHYPNIFPAAWEMVSNYLRIPKERQIMDGFAERAHCMSSDPLISLPKHHGGGPGRTHIVLNFGAGLHLGVCLLREEKNA